MGLSVWADRCFDETNKNARLMAKRVAFLAFLRQLQRIKLGK